MCMGAINDKILQFFNLYCPRANNVPTCRSQEQRMKKAEAAVELDRHVGQTASQGLRTTRCRAGPNHRALFTPAPFRTQVTSATLTFCGSDFHPKLTFHSQDPATPAGHTLPSMFSPLHPRLLQTSRLRDKGSYSSQHVYKCLNSSFLFSQNTSWLNRQHQQNQRSVTFNLTESYQH